MNEIDPDSVIDALGTDLVRLSRTEAADDWPMDVEQNLLVRVDVASIDISTG